MRLTVNQFAEHKREKNEFQAYSQAERKTEKKNKTRNKSQTVGATELKKSCLLRRDADERRRLLTLKQK